MNRRISLLSAAIAASLAVAALPAFSADFRTAKNPIRGQYIVVLKDTAPGLAGARATAAARVSALATDLAARHRITVGKRFAHALPGFVAQADDDALARLLADPAVAYIEEDGIVTVNAIQTGATWGLDRVDQRDLPLSTTYTYDTTAAGVHAYIIDTGILTGHTQFTGRMGNGFRAIADDGRGTSDCNGHGTHVAGTVGGTTYGVAKGVTLHPVRVFGCGNTGSNSDIIAGIDWVAANRVLPAVANMSLGGGASTTTDTAVNNLIAQGVVAVVAAGNSGTDACLSSPARVPNAITVGSTGSNDARSVWSASQSSSWGTCLDIFAPGTSILSAGIASTSATATLSGTSMASPHVAGAAALQLAVNPSATPAQVTSAIIANATLNKVTDPRTGSPNRLLYTLGGGGGGNVPPVANFSSSVSGLTATFTDSSTDSDGSIVSRSWNFGDGTTSTATNPSRTYATAGTYTVTLTVTDDDGATHIRTASVSVGTVSSQTYTNDTDVQVPDNTTVYSNILVSGRTGNALASTPVAVNIVHSYKGDLVVDLLAPDGSVYNLHNRTGGSADNIIQTFNVNLSTEPRNGQWRLRVRDAASADSGYINSWSITF